MPGIFPYFAKHYQAGLCLQMLGDPSVATGFTGSELSTFRASHRSTDGGSAPLKCCEEVTLVEGEAACSWASEQFGQARTTTGAEAVVWIGAGAREISSISASQSKADHASTH